MLCVNILHIVSRDLFHVLYDNQDDGFLLLSLTLKPPQGYVSDGIIKKRLDFDTLLLANG